MVLSLLLGNAPLGYVTKELAWRRSEEAALRGDTSWLSLSGLFWLDEKVATVGSASGNDVRIKGDGVPAIVGTATRIGKMVTFQADPGSGATLNGRSFGTATLRSDAEGQPDRIRVGALVVTTIVRGERVGFRVADLHSEKRRTFKGLRWFPIDPKYRIVARFVPYTTPKAMPIRNVLGDTRMAMCPGYAEFRMAGQIVRLDAEAQSGGLFFDFRDRTSGKETYGAGRFLDAEKPKDGKVVLDFNRATNPPCAFTDFATCPLPPERNFLKVAIRAGALNGHEE